MSSKGRSGRTRLSLLAISGAAIVALALPGLHAFQSSGPQQATPAERLSGLHFEVASVSVSSDVELMAAINAGRRLGMKVVGDRVDIESTTLNQLVCRAYSMRQDD